MGVGVEVPNQKGGEVEIELLGKQVLEGVSWLRPWWGNIVIHVNDAEVDRVIVVDVNYCSAVV